MTDNESGKPPISNECGARRTGATNTCQNVQQLKLVAPDTARINSRNGRLQPPQLFPSPKQARPIKRMRCETHLCYQSTFPLPQPSNFSTFPRINLRSRGSSPPPIYRVRRSLLRDPPFNKQLPTNPSHIKFIASASPRTNRTQNRLCHQVLQITRRGRFRDFGQIFIFSGIDPTFKTIQPRL